MENEYSDLVSAEVEQKSSGSGSRNETHKGKVIVECLCTLIQASSSMTSRLQIVQNSLNEVSLLRQEVVQMNSKLDALINMLAETPEAKSSFIDYFTT